MATSKFAQNLWVEKYRPQHIKDIILPDDFARYFNDIVSSGVSKNLLLASSVPGTGKTTLAKALITDLDANAMEINASSDNGIATLRDKIALFAQTAGTKRGKPKIVILDEADGLTPQFQAALRGYIEEFQTNCRFVLTCNNLGKIIPALRDGRTDVFNFNMANAKTKAQLKKKMASRLAGILTHEKVEFDVSVIMPIVETYYPSVRTMISVLQKYYQMNGKVDDGILTFKQVDNVLGDLIAQHKITEARNLINSNGYSEVDVIRFLFDEYIPTIPEKAIQFQSITILAEYEFRCTTSRMPDLQIADMIFKLAQLR